MLNSGRIVRLTCTRTMICYECGEEKGWRVFGDLRLQGGEEERQCGWWMVSRFASLSLSQIWSSGMLVSFAFYWSVSAVEKFVFYSVFVFQSDQVVFSLFLPRRSRIDGKITFNYFYFLTNFIDISLCADPMRRSPFFQFEESLSTDNIRWMLSWTLVGIIILCVR